MPNITRVPTLPVPTTPFERELVRTMSDYLRQITEVINNTTNGKFAMHTGVAATKPTLPGSRGDFIANTERDVLGTPPSQYVVWGWFYGSDDLWHDITSQTDG